VGVELDLDRVPAREEGMTAYELMLSESQERMLMVLKPGHEPEAEAIFAKWALDFAVVGRITDSRHMVLRHHGAVVADLPIDPLALASPEYDRPVEPTPASPVIEAASIAAPADPMGALSRLLRSPDLASKRWVWEQYDHMVMASTVQRPGGDAAVVRIPGTSKALAMTADCTPRYCYADPVMGGRQAVAEAWRNLTAAGAKPLAITDCLNFGNPEKPRIMGQFAHCIEGMAEACRALDFPVVSGNVSLYNETNGVAIPPTPTVGGVGLIADLARMVTPALKAADEVLVLIGQPADGGWLGRSLYLREIEGRDEGAPPPVDLAAERRHGDFVRTMITAGRLTSCHDISDGGLLVAVAEMAIAGGIGVTLDVAASFAASAGWLFGEDQGRYLVTVPEAGLTALATEAALSAIPIAVIGHVGGDRLTLPSGHAISVFELARTHEAWLPAFMAAQG
jgi:phosphoribosylformylglycinamidine synthase subunit II (EC 6.3.5.3)